MWPLQRDCFSALSPLLFGMWGLALGAWGRRRDFIMMASCWLVPDSAAAWRTLCPSIGRCSHITPPCIPGEASAPATAIHPSEVWDSVPTQGPPCWTSDSGNAASSLDLHNFQRQRSLPSVNIPILILLLNFPSTLSVSLQILPVEMPSVVFLLLPGFP